MAWRNFAERNPDLPVGVVIQGATATEVPPDVIAAYEAPWPNAESKAGVAQFPLIVPISPDAPGVAEMNADARPPRRVGQAGARGFSDSDPIFTPKAGQRFVDLIPGARGPVRDRGRRPFPPGGPGRDRGGDQQLPRACLSARSSSCSSAAAWPPATAPPPARAGRRGRHPAGGPRARPALQPAAAVQGLPAREGVARGRPVPARRLVRRAARRAADAHERDVAGPRGPHRDALQQGPGPLRQGAACHRVQRARSCASTEHTWTASTTCARSATPMRCARRPRGGARGADRRSYIGTELAASFTALGSSARS